MPPEIQKLRERLQDLVADGLSDGKDVDTLLASLADHLPPEAAEELADYIKRVKHRVDYAKLFSEPTDGLIRIHATRWNPLMGEIRVAAEKVVETHGPGVFPHLAVALAELDALEKAVVAEFSGAD